MEENKIQRDLMSQEEFEDYLSKGSHLVNFMAISKFKSVKRAIRRGHITSSGIIAPRRPFNNRANTSKRKHIHSRVTNEIKKQIYEQYRQYSGSTL